MPESGWYADPEDPDLLRAWDGTGWTADRRPRGSGSLGAPSLWDAPPSGGSTAPVEQPPDLPAPTGPRIMVPPPPDTVEHHGPAPARSFPSAVRVCLARSFVVRGRASRSEFWYFALFTNVLPGLLGTVSADLGAIVLLLLLVPGLTVSIRRLHDVERSGWYLLLVLIPLIGPVLLLFWFVTPGVKMTDGRG